jgi:hypothetical protein
VDFIIVLPTACAEFGEVHMIGPNAHAANGSVIYETGMTRTAAMVTGGAWSWQNVAFLMESFNHYTATRLNYLKDDFELFKVGDGNNWNEINHNYRPHYLVSSGNGQVGSEHYPVAGIHDYGFGDNDFDWLADTKSWAVSGQWVRQGDGHVIADTGVDQLMLLSDAAINPQINPNPSNDQLKQQEGALFHTSDFDATFSVRLSLPQSDSHAGLMFRVNDFDIAANSVDGYYLALDTESDEVRLVRQNPTASDVIAQAAIVLNEDEEYDVRVSAMGDIITASINGRQIIEAQDSTYLYGAFGCQRRRNR